MRCNGELLRVNKTLHFLRMLNMRVIWIRHSGLGSSATPWLLRALYATHASVVRIVAIVSDLGQFHLVRALNLGSVLGLGSLLIHNRLVHLVVLGCLLAKIRELPLIFKIR